MTALPQDLEAERALLGACLLDSGAIAELAWLDPHDFVAERHAVLWSAIRRVSGRGGAPDVITLRADLDEHGELGRAGGVDYIAELTLEVPSAAAAVAYGRLVVDAATRRRVHGLGRDLQAAAVADDVPVLELVGRAESAVYDLRGGRRERTGRTRHIAEVSRDVWERLDAIQATKDGLTGVPTGFPTLDAATHGLQPGELTLLGARPSVGKSALALNIGENASTAGKRVLFVSIEMTDASLAERLLSGRSQTPSETFRAGRASPAQWAQIAQAVDSTAGMPLWIHDAPGLSLASLRSVCRRHGARHGLDLVVVDYLQLIRTQGRDLRERATEASQGLKELARELDVPVLALTQLNRESERRDNGRPSLADLRDSGSLEQDADVVLLLWRPGMHKPDVDRSVTELLIAKNRTGPTCRVPMTFVAQRTEFRERLVPVGGFE